MTRLTVVALLLIFFGGAVAVWVARFFGKSGSRASILVTVVAQWLAAGWFGVLIVQRVLGAGGALHPIRREMTRLVVIGRHLFFRTGALLATLAASTSVAARINTTTLAGHQIALHMDHMVYGGDLAKALLEVNALAQFYPYINTQLASLHSPINLEQMPIASFAELQNVYGHIFSKEMTYISDSTGRWRSGHPLDSEAFHARRPIQLLTHPIWWIQGLEMRYATSRPGLACGYREEDGETATQKLECWLYKDYLNSLASAEEFLPKLFKQTVAVL